MISLKYSFDTGVKILTILLVFTIINSCTENTVKQKKGVVERHNESTVAPSFKAIWGRRYTEVRRSFSNGTSFGESGYQLEPEWKLSFPSDDSVNIFNPVHKKFVNAPLMFDHDSIFNLAWSWVKLRKLTKDSIVFQIMKVENKVLLHDKSVVYMTLYANDYIKNVLHSTPAQLRLPNKRDTAYISGKVAKAVEDTANAFAARQMVVLLSKSPLVSIESLDLTEERKEVSAISEDYMLPEFIVKIKNTYEDFSYSFTVVVDEKGKIFFRKSINFINEGFEERTIRAMRAITDGYLRAYLKAIPGSTLGMPHSSILILHVMGESKKQIKSLTR